MTYWERKTNVGRVVYDRPPHPFTISDLARIQKKVLETGIPAGAAPETRERWLRLLIFLVDEASEYLVSIMLTPYALGGLADNVVDELKAMIQAIYDAVGSYLRNARGPIGIPGKGVF